MEVNVCSFIRLVMTLNVLLFISLRFLELVENERMTVNSERAIKNLHMLFIAGPMD